jgi:type II secretory pathway pseudopilin PulG
MGTQAAHQAQRRSRSAMRGNRRACRSALSLIEVVASTIIVGMMSVAALNSLGAATRSAESLGDRAVALGLAEELMSEIVQQPYSEPTQTPAFGRETGEAASPRSGFDDVDDYNGWNQSPPRYRDGTAIPDRTAWRHRVIVSRVVPSNPTQTSATESGAKRIQVIIEHKGEVMVERIAVRTDSE